MKTIAAISTPQNAGGIGIIRISGDESIRIADAVFRPTGKRKLCELKGYRAAHGFIFDGEEKIDECVATVFRAPRSYTGEDVVELSCHGGLFVLKKVLRAVFEAGAAPAEAGEFTKRAFLNGKIDLTEAEGVMSIISAQGEQGAKAALSTLEGALSKRIERINGRLLHISAQMGAWVDYPDDEIEDIEPASLSKSLEEVKSELSALLSTFDSGKAVTSGIETAIIGKPNTGKSELMNLLSGFSRSIVTDIPGTTRDVVFETVNLGNVVLRLADTAGIRETSDIVENIGVDRAKATLEKSGLILAVFDRSREFEETDENIISLCKGKRAVAIINKTDLEEKLEKEKILPHFKKAVFLCAKSGEGLESLTAACEELLCSSDFDSSEGILTTERQRNDVVAAIEAVDEAIETFQSGMTTDAVNVCIDSAVSSLLSLTGQRAADAVVEEVFKSFCVGK